VYFVTCPSGSVTVAGRPAGSYVFVVVNALGVAPVALPRGTTVVSWRPAVS
jgi:hypothetical protein